MKLLLTTTLLLFSLFSSAQYTISGYLFDDQQEPLSFASVVLLNTSDSSIVGFGLTNNSGKYLIEAKDSGDYSIQYSFLGYKSQYNPLKAKWDKQEITLSNVYLKEASVELGTVEVAADRIPMKMKGDTLQYDAKAFKVAEGSDVEKLLEKMPGIEIDENGNVTAHGKKVEKILVDGKEFFGDDPQMATKNLEAKAIDKVEVLDKKSETAEFTGVDDGEEQKTINLTLKEEFKKGSFGRASAGVGTEETYKGKVNYNRFSKNTQVSAIGNANNINESPFSWREFNQFAPNNDWNSNLINGIGGREGINQALSVGINMNHDFSDKLEVQGFYYLTQNDNELNKTINTQNFNLDTTYLTDQFIVKEEDKLNHSFNAKLKWKADSMTEINIWSNLFLSDENYDNFSQTIYTPSNEATNFTENITDNTVDNLSTYNEFTLKRKFKKDRRNISFSLNNYYQAEDNFTTIDNERFGEDIIQNQDYNNDYNRFRTNFAYTEPLDSFWVVTGKHEFENEQQTPTREFYDIEADGQRAFNDSLSTAFERVTNENKSSLTFRRNKNKKNFSFGATYTNIELQINDFSKRFDYLTPFASVRFQLKGSQSFSARYYARTNTPNLTQLVTIPNNLDPNRVYIGNPDLKPELSHNLSFNYFSFDPVNSTNIYFGANLSSTNNKIVTQTFINDDFTTTVTPQNSGFSRSFNFWSGFDQPIKKLKIKVGLSPYVSFSNYDAFINTTETEIFSADYSARLSISRLSKEKWQLKVGVDGSLNNRKYEANSRFDQNIKNYGAFATGEYEVTKSLLLKLDYNLRRYAATSFAESREFHYINASIRQSIKNDAWAISLIANDILNQNEGIQRSGDINTLYSTRYNARAQYFMIVLEKSLGKKVENPNRKKGNKVIFLD